MRSIILLALLFGVLVTASPIERDDLEDEEQTPDSVEDEDLDVLEKDSDDGQEDDPEFEDEDSSVSFSCVGKPGHKHDGTIIKYADPNDCHYWYECRQNQQMRFRCHTAGQIFNKDLQYCKPGTCNDVGEGFCAGKPGTKPDGTTIKYVHPDPKKCNYWVECREGKYREYRCHTQGQIFNKDLQHCVKGTCSQTIFDVPFSCVGKKGHKPDGTIIKYKDPTDCHHWYECRQKQTMRFKCHTAGQIFDVDLQHCKPGTCAALGADFCAGKPGTKPDGTIIKYAHPDAKKCTYWVECVDGKYKEYMCHTKGYIFNVGKQFCVKGTCSQPVANVSFSCVGKPGHKHDGTIIKYADPNDCHYWYECRQNQQMRFRCHTAGQIFDKDLQYCKPGTCHDVGEGFCAGKPGTKPDGTTIKYVHPDPTKCNYWVECREGKYREYRCHTHGEIFNKELQYCVKGTCAHPSSDFIEDEILAEEDPDEGDDDPEKDIEEDEEDEEDEPIDDEIEIEHDFKE